MGRYDPLEDKKPNIALIGLIIAILAGAGWLYYSQSQSRTEEPQRKSLELPSIPQSSTVIESPTDNIISDQALPDSVDLTMEALPEEPAHTFLEPSQSDTKLREAMLAVSPALAPWLKTDHIVQKYLTIVNDFSQGLWLEKHMRFLKPSEAFSVENTDKGLVIADQSFRRYDSLAAAIAAIDAKAAAKFYKKFKPLLLEAFNEFGYPADRPLEDIFLKAAAQILAAPIIAEPIALVRPSVFYKFANDELESLSPVSKQMLRMGPKNTRIIQNKVRQLVQELINLKE